VFFPASVSAFPLAGKNTEHDACGPLTARRKTH